MSLNERRQADAPFPETPGIPATSGTATTSSATFPGVSLQHNHRKDCLGDRGLDYRAVRRYVLPP